MGFRETPEFIGGKHAALTGQTHAYDKATTLVRALDASRRVTLLNDTNGANNLTCSGPLLISTDAPPRGGGSILFAAGSGIAGSGATGPPGPEAADFSISMWVKYAQTDSQNWANLASWGTTGSGERFLMRIDTRGDTSAITVEANAGNIVSVETLSLAEWSHVAAVRSAGNLTIYVDGVASTPTAYPDTIPAGRALLFGWAGGGIRRMRGNMSEAAYWTSALTDDNVQWLATGSGTPPPAANNDWPMNASQATFDAGSDGIAQGGVGLTGDVPEGATGEALRCDGADDLLDAGNVSSDIYSGDFTVSGWLKPYRVTGSFQIILDKRSASQTGCLIYINNGNRLAIEFGAESSEVANFFDAETWVHFAIKREGSTLTPYKNGLPVAWLIGGTATGDASNANAAKIGARSFSTPSSFLDASLSDLRVYDQALTDSDILYLATQYDEEPQGINPSAPNVAGWSMDRRGCEFSTQANHGTLLGNAAMVAAPIPPILGAGRALSMPAPGDWVQCGTAPQDVTKPFSACAWVKYNAATPANQYTVMSDWDGAANASWAMRVNVSNFFELLLSTPSGAVSFPTPLNVILPGIWQHIGFSYDPGTLTATLYANGQQAGTPQTSTDNPNVRAGTFRIGNSSLSGDPITVTDDVRLYGRSLTAQEWADLAANAPAQPLDYVGRWDFDDPTILDAPAYAPHGAKSMLFDGVDDVASAGNVLPMGLSSRTIEGWVKTSQVPSGDVCIWGSDSSSSTARNSIRLTSAGQVKGLFDANGTPGANEIGAVINNGQWRHIAVTMDRNGLLRAWADTTPSAGTDISADSAIDVQAANPWGCVPIATRFFHGQLYDCRVYNRLLTSQEITDRSNFVDVPGSIAAHTLDTTRNANTWQIGAWHQTLRDQAGSAHGTLANFPSEPNTGWVEARPSQFEGGWSLAFAASSSQYVTFPQQELGQFTINCWIRAASLPGFQVLLGQIGGTSILFLGLRTGSQTTIRISANGPILNFDNPSPIAVGQWEMVTVSRDASGNINCFLNAIQSPSNPQASGTADTFDIRGIGARGTPASDFFDGSLAEMVLYDRALNVSEIQSLLKARPDPEDDQIRTYYDFRDARHYSGPDTFAADLGNARFPAGAAAEGIMNADEVFASGATFNLGATLESMTLRAAPGDEPRGVPGTGVRISTVNTNALDFTTGCPPRVYVFDIDIAAASANSLRGIQSSSVTVAEVGRVIVRDYSRADLQCIKLGGGTVHNSFFQNNVAASGNATCVSANEFVPLSVYNCSGLNNGATAGTATGVFLNDVATHTAKNNAFINTTGGTSGADFSPAAPVNAVMDHNASGDATASGTGSLTNVAAEDCFIGPGNGSIDLHTFPGSALQDAGTDLSGLDILEIFLDIDRDNRSTGTRDQQVFTIMPFPLAVNAAWDIGADEWVTGQPTGQPGLGNVSIARRRRLAGARR